MIIELEDDYGDDDVSVDTDTASREDLIKRAIRPETRGHRTGCQFPCWYPWASKPT